MANWFNKEVSLVISELKSNLQTGLSSSAAQQRLERIGPNQLHAKPKISPWQILISQFSDFMVLVLIGAAIISGLLGEQADAITIVAIVILNSILGFIQEYRAEKSLQALKDLTAPLAHVLRDSRVLQIPACEVVPGDILVLESGDRIAADGRVVSLVNLEVNEATLTGESMAVSKKIAILNGVAPSIGDQQNMVFAGTAVTSGRGRVVVTATGMKTEIGKIASLINTAGDEETPLQKRLAQLGKWLVILCLVICAMVGTIGILRGEAPRQMFLAAVSLAVAAIPEGLPAIVTIALAVGVQKMIRRKAIIRKLPAVETLGCSTVICSDKTGTLTQNEMTVIKIWDGVAEYDLTELTRSGKREQLTGNLSLNRLLEAGVLCNNALLGEKQIGVDQSKSCGDPTELALLAAAKTMGINRKGLELDYQRFNELPFSSERKRMGVWVRDRQAKLRLVVKGAPDVIAERCTQIVTKEGIKPLGHRDVMEFKRRLEEWSGSALRTLAFAYRPADPVELNSKAGGDQETDLILIGMMGMADPPRPESKAAIERARRAGIQTKMITGDYPRTAAAIARQIGLMGPNGRIISGNELDQLSDEKLAKIVPVVDVFARVSPHHKLRVVRALRKNGAIVAMTGDGVNDAPAVKEADIGVAMGISGTDVTKEAAAMVIADDNFATIVAAVEEGRTIYENIRKFIRYLLSCNIGEILTMLGGILLGLPLPLLPIQILWVNLVTDGLPAIALGVDPATPGVMTRPPRLPREGVFSRRLGLKIILQGVMIATATLLVYLIELRTRNLMVARTAAFAALVLAQLLFVFQCRSESHQPFIKQLIGNNYLVVAVTVSTLMQLGVMTLPWLQRIFYTTSLSLQDWLLVIGFTASAIYFSDILWQIHHSLKKHLTVFRWKGAHTVRGLVGK